MKNGIISKPLVHIVVLNWNTKLSTMETINSIRELTYPNYRIIIVDNGSTDGSQDFFEKTLLKDEKLLFSDKNVGYSSGMNMGINHSLEEETDYVMIVNSDLVLHPDSLTELVSLCETNSSYGFATGKSYYYDDPKRLQMVAKETNSLTLVGNPIGEGEIDHGQYDKVREYPYIDDIFVLIRRSVLDKVAGYDDTFFLLYEEADLIQRSKEFGFKCMFTPKAKAWHKESKSHGKISYTRYFHHERSQIIFVLKHQTIPKKLYFITKKLLFGIPSTFVSLAIKGRVNLFGATLRGTISGLKYIISNKFK